MKVYVKMLPFPGICDAARDMEFALREGNIKELLICVQEELGAASLPLEMLLFLRNGHGLDIHENVQFHDEDHFMILPQIEGG